MLSVIVSVFSCKEFPYLKFFRHAISFPIVQRNTARRPIRRIFVEDFHMTFIEIVSDLIGYLTQRFEYRDRLISDDLEYLARRYKCETSNGSFRGALIFSDRVFKLPLWRSDGVARLASEYNFIRKCRSNPIYRENFPVTRKLHDLILMQEKLDVSRPMGTGSPAAHRVYEVCDSLTILDVYPGTNCGYRIGTDIPVIFDADIRRLNV